MNVLHVGIVGGSLLGPTTTLLLRNQGTNNRLQASGGAWHPDGASNGFGLNAVSLSEPA